MLHTQKNSRSICIIWQIRFSHLTWLPVPWSFTLSVCSFSPRVFLEWTKLINSQSDETRSNARDNLFQLPFPADRCNKIPLSLYVLNSHVPRSPSDTYHIPYLKLRSQKEFMCLIVPKGEPGKILGVNHNGRGGCYCFKGSGNWRRSSLKLCTSQPLCIILQHFLEQMFFYMIDAACSIFLFGVHGGIYHSGTQEHTFPDATAIFTNLHVYTFDHATSNLLDHWKLSRTFLPIHWSEKMIEWRNVTKCIFIYKW